MANTVSTISYANTFGQWMVATDALIAENNTLATSDYTKNSGTLYLSETTKNSLQANGSVIVQKELRVQGVASSATIDNNLTVSGQVYFSNTTLGLTNSGQANINGLLLAQGSGLGLSVSNNAYIGGNTTIRYTTTTGNIQANGQINTSFVSATGNVIASSLNANVSGSIPNLTISTKLDGNNASGFLNSLQVQSGGLTVNGNFIISGSTTYASNTFQLSTGTASAISSYLQVARGSSGPSAAIRWNEPQIYWDMLNVTTNTYYRILTNEYFNDTLTSTSTTSIATANVANTLNNQLTATNTSLQATIAVNRSYSNSSYSQANSASSFANGAFIQANSAYDSQNTTGSFANSAFIRANSAYSQANSASSFANGAFIQANSAYAFANTTANSFTGTTGSVTPFNNVVSFTSNNGVTIVATAINNLAVSTPQDVRTTASPTFVGGTFSQPVVATTMAAGTSNTALATTAYVQSLANSSGTLTTNITGNAGTVTNGVVTTGSYANPSWITSLASTKITGMYYMDQGVGTANNVQHASFGVGTAASGTAGEIRATNNITAYYSDDNLKTRLGTIQNALDKLCSLTGFYYEANETAQALGYKVKREVGVSAQDVQKVMPEIVVPAPIDEKYLTVYYDKLLPLVIEAIKELKEEVDVLKLKLEQ